MSEQPPQGPPDWAPPPPPPPPPPSEPPAYVPAGSQQTPPEPQQPYYWTQQQPSSPRPRGSNRGLIALVAGVLVVVLLAIVVGGYAVWGGATASSRVSAANDAIAQTQHIDFGTTLFQVKGGFELSSSTFDPNTFSSAVDQFASSVKDDTSSLAGEELKLRSAQRRLGDTSWLTVPERGNLDVASGRIDHALKAIATGKTITGDLTKDGQFYQAWAAALVDFVDYVTAANAGDATTAISKVQAAKSDLAKAAPLSGAPGLDGGIQAYVSDFQTFVSDLDKLINAGLGGDKATHDAAAASAKADAAKIDAVDTSGFDNTITSFYDPLFQSYDQELKLAGG